ncbi:MAG: formate dehydrogenase accessory sulfurtransferase FdhD [Ilumatobacteraceae bacterium]
MSPAANSARRKSTDWMVTTVNAKGRTGSKPDLVVTEEPMEIRAGTPGVEPLSISVTMRTPGHDFELAVGFLFTEGIISHPNDVRFVKYCELIEGEEQLYNIVTVSLAKTFSAALARRAMVTSASCGICGIESIDQLLTSASPLARDSGPVVTSEVLVGLPDALRKAQPTFDRTGGLHAVGLFDSSGQMKVVREDIGRHNAVDKVVGHCVLDHSVPLTAHGLLVSGRVSFEIIQKAAMAGIAFIAAVGAPSSLAVETADRFGITLVGFVRDGTANIYTHPHRVVM